MRQKTRARLEAIDLIEIVIGPDCREMYDLVEAVPEPPLSLYLRRRSSSSCLDLEASGQAKSHGRRCRAPNRHAVRHLTRHDLSIGGRLTAPNYRLRSLSGIGILRLLSTCYGESQD
jgi:hypothetical protein